MTTAATPHTIAGYRIVEPIGAGATSTVYRAVDADRGIEVALKVLADNHSLVADRRKRFLDEAEMLASVESQAVARLYRSGETDDGRLYMALQLADQGDLRRRVAERAAAGISPVVGDLLALGRQLTEGLDALNSVGIVHRDLAPGNMLITGVGGGFAAGASLLEPAERYVLADLGLAKDLFFASGLTAGGGTRGFAAPEQEQDVTIVDTRADVYGASALLGWVLEHADPELARRLDPVLERGTATDPDDRHATIVEWWEEAEAALLDVPPAGPSPARRLLLAGGLASAALVVVAAAVAVGPDLMPGGGSADEASTTVPDGVADAPADADTDDDTGENAADGSAADEPAPGAAGPSTEPTAVGSSSSAVVADDDGAEPGATTPDDDAGTAASTSTAAAATTTTAATSVPATVTTAPGTSTSAIADIGPRAFVTGPGEEASVNGDLVISGTAVNPAGVAHIELAVKQMDTGLFWHDATGAYETTWVRFVVPVTPIDGESVTWTYTISAADLVAGRHRLRVWARGSAGNGDPLSDIRFVEVEA
ncbi:MAG: protein kinase [Actinomycetota bacterium]